MLNTNDVDSETQEKISVKNEENLDSVQGKKKKKKTVPKTSLALSPIDNYV